MADTTEDTTPSKNEDEIENDLLDEDDADLLGDPSKEDTKEDDDKPKPDVDKQAVRADKKYQKAVKRIETLEGKLKERHGDDYGKKDLNEEEKKELKAREYIRKEALEAVKEEQKQIKDAEAVEATKLSDEMDEVLDENPDITKDQLSKVIEEMSSIGVMVRPQQALELLSKMKSSKEKPKMPKPTQTGDTIVKNDQDFAEKIRGKSIEEKMRIARQAALKSIGL